MEGGSDQAGVTMRGGDGGWYWDDGSYHGVREISVVYGHQLISIQAVYDQDGMPVVAEKHGGEKTSITPSVKSEIVKLDYPREFLKRVSGYYGPVISSDGIPVVIRSLTFETNKRTYGPFGAQVGSVFSSSEDGARILGFMGRSDSLHLHAIGFHLSEVSVVADTMQYSPTTMDPRPSQHTESERETSMDPELYTAVKNGTVWHRHLHADAFDNQVTPNGNSILHVAAQFGNMEYVAWILEKKPFLIQWVNLNNENPLHIAVREQHFNIVKELIYCAEILDGDSKSGGGTLQQMLIAINVDGDTPLHLAVREGDHIFVRLLVNKYKDFQHPPNKAGETPLFLAAERNNGDSMVQSILECCESPAYTGPSDITALHAAVISGNTDSIEMLLARNEELINKRDMQGWTPLHYAAYRGNERIVRMLLERNKSVGYIRTAEKDDKRIALHIAAAAGNEKVMEEILSRCPDCWEMVNSKGKNILHIAVEREAECVIDYIIHTGMLKSLMNQKDVEGNTPLHLLASSKMVIDDIINHPRANMYAVNNQGKTPAELAMLIKENKRSSWFSKAHGCRNICSNEEDEATMSEDFLMEREWKESKEVKAENRNSQSHMLVATLIATITFAAGVAIPAGYEANQGLEEGMGALVREAGFKVFFLANTVAVMCSTSSVLCYVFAALYNDDDDEKAECYTKGFFLVLIAVVAMVVGFLSGTYAMLAHFLGLTIATFTIAFISLAIYFRELIRLFIYIKLHKFVAQGNNNTVDTQFNHTTNHTNLCDIV